MIGNVQKALFIIVFIFCAESRVFARVIDNNTELFLFNDDYEDDVIKFVSNNFIQIFVFILSKVRFHSQIHLLFVSKVLEEF